MDRYTKTVLTVIAGCLLVLVGNQIDFPSKAYAAQGDERMLEIGEKGFAYYHDDKQLWFCAGYNCTAAEFNR
jgi:hypothetical protein